MGKRHWVGNGVYCYPNNNNNNTAENFSDICRRHCSYDVDYLTMDISIQSVFILMSIVGNCVLLSLFITKRRAMTRSSVFILNLCCADLCIAFFVTLSSSIEKFMLQFTAPEIFCKLFKLLLVAPLYASAFSILAMGIDRYLAVFYPLLNYRKPLKQSLTIIAMVWCVALLSASPQLAFFAVVDVRQCNVRRCIEVYDRYPAAVLTTYITWFCIVSYFIPAIALLIIYSLICRKIWTRYEIDKISSRHTQNESPQPSENNSTTYDRRTVVRFNSHKAVGETAAAVTAAKTTTATKTASGGSHKKSAKSGSSELKLCNSEISDPTSRVSEAHAAGYKAFANRTKLRMLIMTAVIVALFVLWNAPYACSMIWLTLVDAESPIARTPLFMICTTLANANASFNSWIYICFNRKAVCLCSRAGVSNTDASALLTKQSPLRDKNNGNSHATKTGSTIKSSIPSRNNGSITSQRSSIRDTNANTNTNTNGFSRCADTDEAAQKTTEKTLASDCYTPASQEDRADRSTVITSF